MKALAIQAPSHHGSGQEDLEAGTQRGGRREARGNRLGSQDDGADNGLEQRHSTGRGGRASEGRERRTEDEARGEQLVHAGGAGGVSMLRSMYVSYDRMMLGRSRSGRGESAEAVPEAHEVQGDVHEAAQAGAGKGQGADGVRKHSNAHGQKAEGVRPAAVRGGSGEETARMSSQYPYTRGEGRGHGRVCGGGERDARGGGVNAEDLQRRLLG
jgi:hypothetical protein